MKSYAQNKIMADTIANSYLLAEGKCIVGILTKNKMEEFGVSAKDLDGIVNQLQNTEGVEVALFLYELEEGTYKVSLSITSTSNQ